MLFSLWVVRSRRESVANLLNSWKTNKTLQFCSANNFPLDLTFIMVIWLIKTGFCLWICWDDEEVFFWPSHQPSSPFWSTISALASDSTKRLLLCKLNAVSITIRPFHWVRFGSPVRSLGSLSSRERGLSQGAAALAARPTTRRKTLYVHPLTPPKPTPVPSSTLIPLLDSLTLLLLDFNKRKLCCSSELCY